MTAMLEVRDLHGGYGSVDVLRGVSLEVAPGSVVALMGANGAGKTTTMRLLSGLLRPSRGTILLDGVPIHGLDGSSSRSSLGRAMSARAMASICCSPPDKVPACWCRRSFRRGKRS